MWKDNIRDDFKNCGGMAWIGFVSLRIETREELCGHGDQTWSFFLNASDFLTG
jgi:hypothetical protein